MRKLLAIILFVTIVFNFSACESSKKDNFFESEGFFSSGANSDTEINYPILFFEDDILYYLKNANESPFLVYKKPETSDGSFSVFTNPTDPNLVVCVNITPFGYFNQYYLDTTPYPDSIAFADVDLFRYCNYTPDGKYFFFVDNEWNMEFYRAQTKENFDCAFTVDDIFTIGINYILFEDNSSKFYYLSYDREENKTYISSADANTGYKKRIMDISDFENWDWSFTFDYFKNGKLYFWYDLIKYELNVVTGETKKVNDDVWWDDGTLICSESSNSEVCTECFNFGGEIIECCYTYGSSEYYVNLFKLQNGDYVFQYIDSDKIANLCYYDGKNIKTLMKDNNYYFIQPLNNRELLLFETDSNGTNNLVIYEIETGNKSVVYKNFKGDKYDIAVTYDWYKIIL